MSYAETYARSHTVPVDFDYAAGYGEYPLLDSLLDNYRLLIVGAGTGGFVRLMKNYREVVCIDRSQDMINAAIHRPNVSFACADFMEYEGGTFDAISLSGTYGSYEPWTRRERVFRKAKAMLNDGGLLVVSHVPPASLVQHAKDLLAPSRTIVIRTARFLALAASEGFSEGLRLHRGPVAISILRAMRAR